MKLRHPTLIKAAGFAGALALRCWLRTLRYRYFPLGPNLDPRTHHVRGRHIYAFWHENLLLPAGLFAGVRAHVLVSKSADGQLIAEICKHLGLGLIRGSKKHGAVEAVRRILSVGGNGHLGITPDGPRGPRRQVQEGVIFLASRLGLPIVPAGFGFERPWRLRSWDRFILPRPGTRATCVTADPILVPAHAERDLLEKYRFYVECQLNELTTLAERWAEAGVPPVGQAAPLPEERKIAG